MKKRTYGFETVAGLFLICVFAAAMFLALESGAGIYKDISAVLDEQYSSRTALSYVAAKVHACDARGAVGVGELGGEEALCLAEVYDGVNYMTYIYCYDGYIMELFCSEGEIFAPTDGLRVLAAEDIGFSMNGALLRIDCTTKSGAETQYVCVSSAKGGGV